MNLVNRNKKKFDTLEFFPDHDINISVILLPSLFFKVFVGLMFILWSHWYLLLLTLLLIFLLPDRAKHQHKCLCCSTLFDLTVERLNMKISLSSLIRCILLYEDKVMNTSPVEH